jgi:5'-nucleotidase
MQPGPFYNVNLPLLSAGAPDPEVILCPLDPKPLPLNYRHESACISRATTTSAAARPKPMSMFALTANIAVSHVKLV